MDLKSSIAFGSNFTLSRHTLMQPGPDMVMLIMWVQGGLCGVFPSVPAKSEASSSLASETSLLRWLMVEIWSALIANYFGSVISEGFTNPTNLPNLL